MFENFDFDAILQSLPYLFGTGMMFTIKLTLIAMTGGIILGTLLALARLSKTKTLSLVAGIYVNLIRSIPLILVIFWFYFLVPYLGAWIVRSPNPLEVGALKSAVITFTMFEAAYYCEIIRAGINGIPIGQKNAGIALGMTPRQLNFYVILPQAIRAVFPIIITQTIILFQEVSLVYVISLTDFVGAASTIAQRDGRALEMYIFIALIYFVICSSLSTLVRRFKMRRAY